MPIEEAVTFFENVPSIRRKIETLNEVGLGYLKLGHPSTSLSGGEAQRVKLATELSKKSTGKTIYILDEPTTGLHFDDVKKLIEILQRLTANGNTVVVIEHNLDVIKCADYIIDIGPEGGDRGGTVVAEGTPEQIAKNKKSFKINAKTGKISIKKGLKKGSYKVKVKMYKCRSFSICFCSCRRNKRRNTGTDILTHNYWQYGVIGYCTRCAKSL